MRTVRSQRGLLHKLGFVVARAEDSELLMTGRAVAVNSAECELLLTHGRIRLFTCKQDRFSSFGRFSIQAVVQ